MTDVDPCKKDNDVPSTRQNLYQTDMSPTPETSGPRIKFGKRSVALPRARWARMLIGFALIIFGFLGFLPILGFWMIPLGLIVLSNDLAVVRRKRRQFAVWWGRRRSARNPTGT